jgi:hypothetical protein
MAIFGRYLVAFSTFQEHGEGRGVQEAACVAARSYEVSVCLTCSSYMHVTHKLFADSSCSSQLFLFCSAKRDCAASRALAVVEVVLLCVSSLAFTVAAGTSSTVADGDILVCDG